MKKELEFCHPELIFLLLCIKAIVSQDLKSYSQVFDMLLLDPRVDENIIDENDDKLI